MAMRTIIRRVRMALARCSRRLACSYQAMLRIVSEQ